ncbi:Na+/H+ antiporter NhaA [Salinicola corii]
MDWQLTAAIIGGLVLGKPIGVVAFSYIAVRARLGVLPEELSWPLILGGALLTGIGFTMALLIAGMGWERLSLHRPRLAFCALPSSLQQPAWPFCFGLPHGNHQRAV